MNTDRRRRPDHYRPQRERGRPDGGETLPPGLTAASPTTTLILSDLKLTGNTAGGTITGVRLGFLHWQYRERDVDRQRDPVRPVRRQPPELQWGQPPGAGRQPGHQYAGPVERTGAVGVTLTGPGSLEGFAGTATIPGLIFTNIGQLLGNGAAGSALSGLNAPATWTCEHPDLSQYTSGGTRWTFTGFSTLIGGADADNFEIQWRYK